MREIEYINPPQWAKACGVSRQRVHQVLQWKELPPGIERIPRAKSWTYRIPKGTPWPEPRDYLTTRMPPGYLSVGQWADKCGKGARTVYNMIYAHGAPEGSIQDGCHCFIPEGAEWKYPRPGNAYGRRGKPGANRG